MLKAVLFDFNGVIINDEQIHQQLINQMLIEENLRPQPGEFRKFCLGRSGRICLRNLLTERGRVVSESYLTQLVSRKAEAYQHELEKLEKLPTYPGLKDLIFQLRSRDLKLAVVSGSTAREVELVLSHAGLSEFFTVIVAEDNITTSKSEPGGYLLAVERLNQLYPSFNLQASECLAIEDTFAGIEAAKQAGVPVVGVAHTYPFHMLQRRASWTVDYLNDLEIDRVQQIYSRTMPQTT